MTPNSPVQLQRTCIGVASERPAASVHSLKDNARLQFVAKAKYLYLYTVTLAYRIWRPAQWRTYCNCNTHGSTKDIVKFSKKKFTSTTRSKEQD